MALLDSVDELFNTGDPLVRSWSLVRSFWIPLACSLLYLFFVKRLGPALMRGRQPFDLRRLMMAYNLCIVLIYTYCLGTFLYYLMMVKDAYQKICTPHPIIKGHYTYNVASAGWYIYALKYIEFSDTVFFVMRKKFHLITNLHVIHHAVLPIIGWILMRIETSGLQLIPGGINSFVHIVMYTYYGLAAMGPDIQKKLWWKEYLTLLQMAQFVIIILFVLLVVPLIGCTTSKSGIYIDITLASLFLFLFYNFYTKTYKRSLTRPLAANGTKQE